MEYGLLKKLHNMDTSIVIEFGYGFLKYSFALLSIATIVVLVLKPILKKIHL